MNSIFHRRSIRKFTRQPVEAEKVELLLRAAMAAPSACNQQPWEYYVITASPPAAPTRSSPWARR